MKTVVLTLFAALAASGQQLDLKSLDRLDDLASEKANISLDAEKLKMAAKFLSGGLSEQQAKSLVTSMKGIFVRTFEFQGPGAYSQSDLEPLRRQLKGPGWSKFIEVKDKNESAEVYFFSENNQYSGLAVIAAEPNELVVVNIVGPVDISTLASLSGAFGADININMFGGGGRNKSSGSKKGKEDDDE